MAVIVPAILEENIYDFHLKMEDILKIGDLQRVQVDISDGKFTNHKTISLNEIEVLNPAFYWEAHLMVESPQNLLLDAKIAGFNCVVFHIESVNEDSIEKTIAEAKNLKLQVGLALNPETPIEKVLPFAHMIDQIILLSVKPGYQGGEFIDSTHDKLKKLKNEVKDVIIEVDGAIKIGNVKQLVDEGADFLVVGSGLYEENRPAGENFELLEAQAVKQEV